MLNNRTTILHPLLSLRTTFRLLTSQGLCEIACATAFIVAATFQLWSCPATGQGSADAITTYPFTNAWYLLSPLQSADHKHFSLHSVNTLPSLSLLLSPSSPSRLFYLPRAVIPSISTWYPCGLFMCLCFPLLGSMWMKFIFRSMEFSVLNLVDDSLASSLESSLLTPTKVPLLEPSTLMELVLHP